MPCCVPVPPAPRRLLLVPSLPFPASVSLPCSFPPVPAFLPLSARPASHPPETLPCRLCSGCAHPMHFLGPAGLPSRGPAPFLCCSPACSPLPRSTVLTFQQHLLPVPPTLCVPEKRPPKPLIPQLLPVLRLTGLTPSPLPPYPPCSVGSVFPSASRGPAFSPRPVHLLAVLLSQKQSQQRKPKPAKPANFWL